MQARFVFKFLAGFGLVLLLLQSRAYCQMIPLPLEQRIDKASVIFEGKVTAKASSWDVAHQQIYTTNTVIVYKVFKGNLNTSQVAVITLGGVVGHDMEEVSHSLQLNIGDVGVFTAIADNTKLAQSSSLTTLRAYSGAQGFIKYNLERHTASDPFNNYKSITGDVYPAITNRTKASINTIKKADFNIQ